MMGVFADLERSTIRERVLTGMSRAVATGTRGGKPIGRAGSSLRPRPASVRPSRGDIGMRKVAVQFGVATGTVQRIAAAACTLNFRRAGRGPAMT
jgi:DNA invertase Pin-like site-specific DNA recombinase